MSSTPKKAAGGPKYICPLTKECTPQVNHAACPKCDRAGSRHCWYCCRLCSEPGIGECLEHKPEPEFDLPDDANTGV